MSSSICSVNFRMFFYGCHFTGVEIKLTEVMFRIELTEVMFRTELTEVMFRIELTEVMFKITCLSLPICTSVLYGFTSVSIL